MVPEPPVADESGGRDVLAHQVLHGYRDGHRALASSLALPPAASKILLRLSDAGDVAAEGSYPTLLSGFPLPGTSYYAVSKTWPAPESERPGAVWSHTLLIDVQELIALSPSDISLAFRRPQRLPDSHYSAPVRLQSEDRSPIQGKTEQIALLIWALYEGPEKPVCAILSAMRPVLREYLLLSLLLHQWPDLQRSFSFAEAPSWERRIQDHTFDLHATTPSGMSAITKARSDEFRVVREKARSEPPAWARLAADELFEDHGLRGFLGRFGPSLPAQRGSVSSLAEIWTSTLVGDEDHRLDSLLHLLNQRFPQRTKMAPLKIWLLGEESELLSDIGDGELLKLLAGSHDSQCLSASTLRISQRAARLWENSRHEALGLLKYVSSLSDEENSYHLVPHIMKGLVRGVTSNDVVELAKTSPATLHSLLRQEPVLLTKRKVWRSDRKTVKRLIRFAASLDPSEELVRMIVESILAVSSPNLASLLFKEWPGSIAAVLEIVTQDPTKSGWVQGLSADLVQDSRASFDPRLVIELAAALSFKEVMGIPIEFWIYSEPALAKADGINGRALASLLGAGLVGDISGADELSVLAYSQLYPVLVESRIDDEDVRSYLESLSLDAEAWDLAKGIAIALAEAFRTRSAWRVGSLLLIADRRAFEDLLNHDAERYPGTSLAASLAAMVPEVQMTPVQSRVVRDILRKYGQKEDLLDIIESLWKRFFS